MKLIEIIICMAMVLFFGCDSPFTWDEEINLGQLNNIEGGYLLIHVELKHTINGWHIIFGDPEDYDRIKNIDEEILNQKLTVYIVNKNDVELTIRNDNGLVKISPNLEQTWFYGTLSKLIFTTRSIQTSHFYETPCKFDIKINFDNKDVKIVSDIPIKIRASWSDAL